MRKISNEFGQGELTIIIFWVIFEDIASGILHPTVPFSTHEIFRTLTKQEKSKHS